MALPAGLAKQRRELTKFWLKWRFALIAAVAAVLFLILANFGYQTYLEGSQTSQQAEIQQTASQLAGRVATTINRRLQAALPEFDADALGATLANGTPDALREAEAILAGASDSIVGARLLGVGVTATDYESVPPVSFATLDMLRRSGESGEAPPPEVHLFKSERQHIATVHRLATGDVLVGHVLVGLKLGVLTESMKSIDVGAGYAELVQAGGGSSLVLAKHGDANVRQGPAALRSKVVGTAWRVAYWMPGMQIAEDGDGGVLLVSLVSVFTVLVLATGAAVFIRRRRESLATPKAGPVEADDLQDKLAALRGGGESPAQAEAGAAAPTQDGDDTLAPDAEGAASAPPRAAATEISPSIFRAYDIRGVVGETLSAEIVREIGRAIGSEAYDRGQPALVVGCDGRLSSPDLLEALVDGLRTTGRDVIDVGTVPTPVLYFATHYLNTGSGVMLTGSHNPPQYNGLKIMLGGDTLFGDDIAALRTRIESGALSTGDGSYQNMDVIDEYIRRVSEDIPVALGGAFKVALDCGNGVAGAVAPKLIRALGHDVVELFCDVDGNFPNHHPDPSDPKNLSALIEAVQSEGADIGFAFDGDGDRLGVVDSGGNIIWPDRQLMLFAIDVLSRNPGAEIVFDVKCTSRLAKVIKAKGGKPVMWKTGHSYIKNKLKECGAPLAGEMSGHLFFQERWYGFDDAIYAAARMLEILMGLNRDPKEIFAKLPSGISTAELRLDMQEGENFAFMETLMQGEHFADGTVSTIDGLRVDFADSWGLVRASNTTPSLVLRFEGDDQEALDRVQEAFRTVLLGLDSSLQLPF